MVQVIQQIKLETAFRGDGVVTTRYGALRHVIRHPLKWAPLLVATAVPETEDNFDVLMGTDRIRS